MSDPYPRAVTARARPDIHDPDERWLADGAFADHRTPLDLDFADPSGLDGVRVRYADHPGDDDRGDGAAAGFPLRDLVRPAPPRTWRDRLDDVRAAAPPPGRVLAGAVAAVVLGLVGWRLLAPAPPPPEMELPFAEPAAAPAADPGGSEPDSPTGAAEVPTDPASGGEDAATGVSTPAGEVVVHVAGAVATPGVRRLEAGARVIDGVEAAGGALPDADLARVNLAAPLVDGQQVYVPRRGEVPPVPLPGAGTDPAGSPGGPVDVNSATAEQLDELPGIGPATAEAIIAHRDEHGPFASVDDLLDVRGIGEAKLEQLRDLVTV
jgi:competence protein ComEA